MKMATTANTDALANPTYNPDLDQSTLQLMNIMGNTYPDDVVAQYRQAILAMPTANPYPGVLSNPRSCDISQAHTGVGEARVALTNRYNSIILSGTPVPSLTPTGAGSSSS